VASRSISQVSDTRLQSRNFILRLFLQLLKTIREQVDKHQDNVCRELSDSVYRYEIQRWLYTVTNNNSLVTIHHRFNGFCISGMGLSRLLMPQLMRAICTTPTPCLRTLYAVVKCRFVSAMFVVTQNCHSTGNFTSFQTF
jgi:hypothetical protein